jgi:hypothetical protein
VKNNNFYDYGENARIACASNVRKTIQETVTVKIAETVTVMLQKNSYNRMLECENY